MFSKKGNNPTQTEPSQVNIIAAGTKVTGEIVSNSDFRLNGKLKGNITTEGKIILGDTGEVEGNIKCRNADIYGKVIGNIIADDVLVVKSTGNITGDIKTNKLNVDVGALFNGSCDMPNRTSTSTGGKEK